MAELVTAWWSAERFGQKGERREVGSEGKWALFSLPANPSETESVLRGLQLLGGV